MVTETQSIARERRELSGEDSAVSGGQGMWVVLGMENRILTIRERRVGKAFQV